MPQARIASHSSRTLPAAPCAVEPATAPCLLAQQADALGTVSTKPTTKPTSKPTTKRDLSPCTEGRAPGLELLGGKWITPPRQLYPGHCLTSALEGTSDTPEAGQHPCMPEILPRSQHSSGEKERQRIDDNYSSLVRNQGLEGEISADTTGQPSEVMPSLRLCKSGAWNALFYRPVGKPRGFANR
jgi:hypothetical protein